MGTTSPKSLRYPEPTGEARQVHTRIKDLADDVNAALTTQDTRLNGLDSKTDTTNTNTTANGIVVARASGYIPQSVGMPNDWIERQPYFRTYVLAIPANARTALVSMSLVAHCNWNAEVYWNALVSPNNTGSWVSITGGNTVTHNQNQPGIDLGFYCETILDVRSGRNNYIALACNAINNAGSGGWIDPGYLHYAVTIMS